VLMASGRDGECSSSDDGYGGVNVNIDRRLRVFVAKALMPTTSIT